MKLDKETLEKVFAVDDKFLLQWYSEKYSIVTDTANVDYDSLPDDSVYELVMVLRQQLLIRLTGRAQRILTLEAQLEQGGSLTDRWQKKLDQIWERVMAE